MIKKKIIAMIIMIGISAGLLFLFNNKNIHNNFSNKMIYKEGFFFDTYVKITLYDCKENKNCTKDFNKILDECMELCATYEKVFSPTDTESELYKLNHNNDYLSGKTVTFSSTLEDIIKQTITITEPFNCKFSIYSGDLCNLWDFTSKKIPSTAEIDSALYNINNNVPTSITLGASAKGYIADKLATHIKSYGINEALIDLGGNIIAIGDKYNDELYGIGIKKPFESATDLIATMKIKDKSVVTSGIYERYFEKNGNIYHHIIDIETGYPADNDILSVTIIADSSLVADCYSTGCLLMGIDYTLDLVNNKSFEDVECIIVDKNYNIHLSDGLEKKEGKIYFKKESR